MNSSLNSRTSSKTEFAEPQFVVPGHTLGGYEIIERLGEGASSNVYRAYAANLACHVALKVFKRPSGGNEANHKLALLEPKRVSQLKHPHIVAVLNAQQLARNRFMVVSEFINGTTLRENLAEFRLQHQKTARVIAKLAFGAR